ncbi:hypothetical protein GLE_0162 [Lysobacter enzymogenes]|uniref:Uncharacterized protein n=1 Tax=Lysobacter enzymogenes TaxID=69 RepID=A0A0S2DAQ8_LYSEN|nr:hypothetical protein GLE_0162 [Lysobacter enzymogenes]
MRSIRRDPSQREVARHPGLMVSAARADLKPKRARKTASFSGKS